MDTMSEATARLRSAGSIESWSAEAGKLRCAECATGHGAEIAMARSRSLDNRQASIQSVLGKDVSGGLEQVRATLTEALQSASP